MVCSRTILGFIVSKEGKTLDHKKIKVLVKIPMLKTPQEFQIFDGMAQFYKHFINFFSFVVALITKLLKKVEMFEWIVVCQIA
jgi:hypothetical protein